MSNDYKQKAVDLLKALETRDSEPFSYINPHKYIQHNLDVGDGPAGVAALAKSLPPETKVKIVRAFQDGDFAFVHVAYDFFGPKIGFDIFRFEDGLIVEHWETITDLDRTEANKALMRRYMDDLLGGRRETFPSYFNGSAYIQHNPWIADTIPGLLAGLKALAEKGKAVVYKKVHMILGEGDFVLVVAEATFGDVPTGIYDLYRIEDGKIAEHWDTLQAIPPRSDWKNSNGKF
jgi:predicted SnoaL-like aldol condensation-catalyzing enzyme